MKTIVYISGSRSDYSPMKRTLFRLHACRDIKLIILCTCMHLSYNFGYTVREIENDGFRVKKVDMLIDNDTPSAMVKSFGIGVYGIAHALEDISPDVIFIEGDRMESLAGAIFGSHMNIPVVHHGGGDISSSIDHKIRYAITMFSDYHLVGNEKSHTRLIRMGIPENRVFNVGEPGLDDIYANDFTQKKEVIKKYNINPDIPLTLLIYHPNTKEYGKEKFIIKKIIEAIKQCGVEMQTYAIYSNADAGGRCINEMLKKYSNEGIIKKFSHIERRDFLGLMNVCNLMIGNSSSGIIELPSFKKPFVYVGSRQKNRLIAGNVIKTNYNKNDIIKSIKIAMYDENFKKKLKNIKNPYRNGDASLKILEVLLKCL